MEEKCVICDAPVPEGTQVCYKCNKRSIQNGGYGGAMFEPRTYKRKTITEIIQDLFYEWRRKYDESR